MSANIRFGPTRTFCLDFEANLHGSSYLPTYYLLASFCSKKPLAAGARKLVSRLLCSVQQRGLELGYIEHKPRGGLVYSALQSAWHGSFLRDFSLRELLSIVNFSITFFPLPDFDLEYSRCFMCD
jgi:hypothetical protein